MKKVVVKRSTRVCSDEIGGCNRTIFQGEIAWLQMRTKVKTKRKGYPKTRRYLCNDCYKRIAQ